MRQAISIAVRDGLVEIRRGRGGGLAVAAPALAAVGSAIRTYLEVARVSPAELDAARLVLEDLAIRLAARKMDRARVEALRRVARESEGGSGDRIATALDMLRELLLASGNAALLVFGFALAQVTMDLSVRHGLPGEELARRAGRALALRRAMIEAVIAADLGTAHQRLVEHIALTRVPELAAKRRIGDRRLMDLPRRYIHEAGERASAPTRAEQLTDRLLAEIITRDSPVGTHLGTEGELLKRHGVSRGLLREAIRPLERLGVVAMQRGRHSGLKVSEPNPQAIVKSAVLYLAHSKLGQAEAFEVQSALELEAAALIALLPGDAHTAAVARMTSLVEGFRGATHAALIGHVRAFYVALAQTTGNPIVSLFMTILGETMDVPERPGVPGDGIRTFADILRDHHRALVAAIASRDPALARRRMIELRRLSLTLSAAQRSAEEVVGLSDGTA